MAYTSSVYIYCVCLFSVNVHILFSTFHCFCVLHCIIFFSSSCYCLLTIFHAMYKTICVCYITL